MRSFIFSSNAVKLSWRHWFVVLCLSAGVFYLLPRVWPAVESFEPSEDYRMPYQMSDDYWVFTQWSKYCSGRYEFLVIGDSVIWGQYVRRQDTLSHYLNELAGGDLFANMGIDGMHPAAMIGLVKYYGREISHKGVVLHLNPLWMTSKKHDLRGEEQFRFNHPRLVPQLVPNLACYTPSLAERIGAVSERNIPFFSWTRHLKIKCFENMNIQDWTIHNPYKNPLKAIVLEVPEPENGPAARPISWNESGVERQDFPWVEAEESFQWDSFKRVIEVLRARRNNVFVLIGPFNPYILTERSSARYGVLGAELESWLKKNRISCYLVPDLPSRYYADASHPLKDGYRKIAEGLFETELFQQWMKGSDGEPSPYAGE